MRIFVNQKQFRFLSRVTGGFIGGFLVFLIGGVSMALAQDGTQDISEVASNVIDDSVFLPGVVSLFAYLTGLFLGVKGVLDLKTNVESGGRDAPLKLPIIEFICSGLLLALPFTYEVVIESLLNTEGGSTGPFSVYGSGGSNTVYAMLGGEVHEFGSPSEACAAAGNGWSGSFASVFCGLWERSSTLPGLLSAFSYIAGLTLLYLSVVNLKASVENPAQNSLWKPLGMIFAAGGLLVFPYIIGVFLRSVMGEDGDLVGQSEGGFDLHSEGDAGQTLDFIVGNFIFNIHGITQFLISGFCYLAGMIFIMIGVFRMMKTMQDGARGPGGIGTIMTFLTGAALIAIGPMMGAVATSLFGDSVAKTNVDLTIPGGAVVEYTNRLENFISAVLAYMIVVGWVAFVRGLFIVRQVAEGDQQSSMMAALTHILGGAILVNLGNFLNVVQATFGDIPGLPTVDFS